MPPAVPSPTPAAHSVNSPLRESHGLKSAPRSLNTSVITQHITAAIENAVKLNAVALSLGNQNENSFCCMLEHAVAYHRNYRDYQPLCAAVLRFAVIVAAASD